MLFYLIFLSLLFSIFSSLFLFTLTSGVLKLPPAAPPARSLDDDDDDGGGGSVVVMMIRRKNFINLSIYIYGDKR